MAKIDFSALKAADLRSVAPISEGMRPSLAEIPPSVAVPASAAAIAHPAVPTTLQSPVPTVPQAAGFPSVPTGHAGVAAALPQISAIPVQVASAVPPSPVVQTPEPPVSRRPLIRLGGGTVRIETAPAAQAPIMPACPADAVAFQSPVPSVPVGIPAPTAQNPGQFSGTTVVPQYAAPMAATAVQPEIPTRSDSAAPSTASEQPPEIPMAAEVPTDVLPGSENGESEISDTAVLAPEDSIGVVKAAEVLGSKSEELAKEILEGNGDINSLLKKKKPTFDSEDEPSSATRVSSVELTPETTFFPNLGIENDLFSDFEFETDVVKPVKTAEAESVGAPESAVPTGISAEAATESVKETESAQETSEAAELPTTEELTESFTERTGLTDSETGTQETGTQSEMAAADETVATTESAPTTNDAADVRNPAHETVAADGTSAAPSESESIGRALETSYVRTVAEKLSSIRSGGMKNLFGNRKILIPAVASALGVFAVFGYAFFPMEKTSAPESGSPTESVREEPAPTAPATQGSNASYFVTPIKKPNRPTKKAAVSTDAAVVPLSGTGTAASTPVPAVPTASSTPANPPTMPNAPAAPVPAPATPTGSR